MLRYTNLSGAQLAASDLTVAHLEGANLADAQLRRANLFCAYLDFAELRKCQLDKARLVRAHLVRTQMHSASFANADLCGASLINPGLNAETSFLNAKTDASTIVGVARKYAFQPIKNNNGHSFMALLTHALRLVLREKNHLELPASAYREFLAQWNQIDEGTQRGILENAYQYANSPGGFLMAYPNLDI